MSKKLNIAIDGPAGAGKSTVAKMLAHKLGFIYIDTGAMYRAVALEAIRKDIDTQDNVKVAKIVKGINISIELLEEGQIIFLKGENVNNLIRTPEVTIGSSNVAKVPEVRKRLVELQREIAIGNNVVMDGRDIGTVVLPQAELKIFLTASIEERSKRRYNELQGKGNCTISFSEVEQDIKFRDFNDITRSCSPLMIADNAKVLDTTGKTVDEVVDMILDEVRKLNI